MNQGDADTSVIACHRVSPTPRPGDIPISKHCRMNPESIALMIDTLKKNRAELKELCRRYRVRRLDVFGSAATSRGFDPQRSDLDFLVEFEPDQDLGPWLTHYFEFQQELQRLFGHSVDLVMASALKNPYFVREVNRTREPLYAA